MFTIKQIDPIEFRKKTRRATFIIMAIFAVIASPLSHFAPLLLAGFDINPFVLNFSGALVGLFITFWIVKTFYADKPWMQEAMYSWRLKRTLTKLYNVLKNLKDKAEAKDIDAMKLFRYYHLALEQMYQLENNSHGRVDMIAEKTSFEKEMVLLNLDLEQLTFDDSLIAKYKD